MDAGEDYESLAGLAFGDRRRAIGKFGDNRAPPGKLGTVLPVHIQRSATGKGDFDRLHMNPLVFIGVKIEPHACSEIHSVVNGISTEESSGTNPEVVQAIIVARPPEHRGGFSSETPTDRDRVPAGDDHQLVSSQLLFAHCIELTRVRSFI